MSVVFHRGGETMPIKPESVLLDVSKIKAEEGHGCPRCGGKVFMAEEINVRNRVGVLPCAVFTHVYSGKPP